MTKPKKERVNVMFEPEILEVFNSFCSLTGKSRSALINEMLRPAIPTLKSLILLNLQVKLKMSGDEKPDLSELTTSLSRIEEQLLSPLNKLPNLVDNLQLKIKG